MNLEERLKQAQFLLQLTLQTLEREYGVLVEPSLQLETISGSYATSRAAIVCKPVMNWQPPPIDIENAGALNNPQG